ncbi:MAG: TonB-dependent receptor, partial [Opitutaceae bacterium]|nr:TonB-dependent receptor [Opitutaceae bacterium]
TYTLWNFGMRYRLSGGNSRFDQTFAVNVNNVFDLEYLRANKIPGDGRGVFFTYTLGRSSGKR